METVKSSWIIGLLAMKPYIHNYLSVCIIQYIRRLPLKYKSLNGGRKGGVDARQQSYFVGRLDDARQEESTDRRLCATTGKKRKC